MLAAQREELKALAKSVERLASEPERRDR
jgi:hypothetical protein